MRLAKGRKDALWAASLWCAVVYLSAAEAGTCQKPEAGRIEINMEVAKLSFTIPHDSHADFAGDCRLFQPIDILDESIYKYNGDRDSGAFFEYTWAFKGHFWQGWVGELGMAITASKIPEGKAMADIFPASASWMVKLNSVAWRRTGSIDSSSVSQVNYDAPLTGKHFVRVSFNFMGNSKHPNVGWKGMAQQIMDTVVPTLRLVGRREEN